MEQQLAITINIVLFFIVMFETAFCFVMYYTYKEQRSIGEVFLSPDNKSCAVVVKRDLAIQGRKLVNIYKSNHGNNYSKKEVASFTVEKDDELFFIG